MAPCRNRVKAASGMQRGRRSYATTGVTTNFALFELLPYQQNVVVVVFLAFRMDYVGSDAQSNRISSE